jgi:hypothetical protein
MSSIIDSKINETLLTVEKHRLILIYLVQDDGSYGGGYYEPCVDLMGAVGGESINEMIEDAYGSLKDAAEVITDPMPFDVNNIKESVVFDRVECHSEYEMDIALTHHKKGTHFEEINKILLG